jgi:hypothetical protein
VTGLLPLLGLLLGLPLLIAPPEHASELDRELYARLLTRYTRAVDDVAGTRVDYRGLGREPAWQTLVAGLERSVPQELPTPDAKLAFWIDAYNILAIDLVVRNYPVESIRDIGSFLRPVWRREVAHIAAEPVTLHQIEHEILRPMGDPRIHAAIVCASTSCPSLAREPYRPETVDAQLDAAMRRFLADERKGLAIDRQRMRVRLSKIFDWFEEDFEPAGGVLAFAAPYLEESRRRWLEEHAGEVEIEYFDYDWRLNDTHASAR